jgi:hypothetical protein
MDDGAWPRVRSLLSKGGLKGLLPAAPDAPVLRHKVPRLRIVYFVIPRLLGRGHSSKLRLDSIGKSVSEYLRARIVEIPVEWLGHR